jgi:hypothetical protein
MKKISWILWYLGIDAAPKIAVTEKSSNKKTGKILVTKSEKDTCPPSCKFYRDGCYGETGPVSWHWKKVVMGTNATGTKIDVKWKTALSKISNLPDDSLWRHNEVGDLPSGKTYEHISAKFLNQLVFANKGKRGFTYTHKHKIEENFKLIKDATDNGFTINLSGDNVDHADMLVKKKSGPVVVVLPLEVNKNFKTPDGNLVVICPNITDNVTCKDCGLCQIATRKTIVGFPAHGVRKKTVSLQVAN